MAGGLMLYCDLPFFSGRSPSCTAHVAGFQNPRSGAQITSPHPAALSRYPSHHSPHCLALRKPTWALSKHRMSASGVEQGLPYSPWLLPNDLNPSLLQNHCPFNADVIWIDHHFLHLLTPLCQPPSHISSLTSSVPGKEASVSPSFLHP